MFNKRAINLKGKLSKGKFSPGIWVSLSSPTTCEVIADAGFDWIIVDSEHSAFNPEILQYMLMAFKGSNTVPIIRVPENNQVMIKQVLDMGWDGVVTPQTNSAKEAQNAVLSCRYPPIGKRGFGPRRAGNYYRDQDEYVRLANDSIICAIQIENVSAMNEIERIVRVPGIDWILVGPCDMSGTTDKFLDMNNPELWKAIRKIFKAAQDKRIPTGNAFGGIQNIDKQLEFGCQLIFLGEDTLYLKDAADNSLKVFYEIIN